LLVRLRGLCVRGNVEYNLLGLGELLVAEGTALMQLVEFLQFIRDVGGLLAGASR